MDGIIYMGLMTVVFIAFALMIRRTNEEESKEQEL